MNPIDQRAKAAALREKLRTRDKADFDQHCKTFRESQGKEAGEEAFDELIDFLAERNAAAALALEARREDLLAFHRLDVSSTLNVTFLSTNIIENMFRNWREASGNVKRWREKGDMISRWVASGMLWAEAGFRKIRHAKDLGELTAALTPSASATSLRRTAPRIKTIASPTNNDKTPPQSTATSFNDLWDIPLKSDYCGAADRQSPERRSERNLSRWQPETLCIPRVAPDGNA